MGPCKGAQALLPLFFDDRIEDGKRHMQIRIRVLFQKAAAAFESYLPAVSTGMPKIPAEISGKAMVWIPCIMASARAD